MQAGGSAVLTKNVGCWWISVHPTTTTTSTNAGGRSMLPVSCSILLYSSIALLCSAVLLNSTLQQ